MPLLAANSIDWNVIIPSVAATAAVVTSVIGARRAGQAVTNTQPNGHGPLPEAVGQAVDAAKAADAKAQRLIDWVGAHDVQHAWVEAHTAADLRGIHDQLTGLATQAERIAASAIAAREAADEAAKIVAENLAAAQRAVDDVAVDLDASRSRADAIGQGHDPGTASDAAARHDPQDKP